MATLARSIGVGDCHWNYFLKWDLVHHLEKLDNKLRSGGSLVVGGSCARHRPSFKTIAKRKRPS